MGRLESLSWEFLSQAPDYADAAALEDHFSSAIEAFGFEGYSCTRAPSYSPRATPRLVARRGLAAWDDHYIQTRYLAGDPCRTWVASSRTGFSWSDVRRRSPRAAPAMWADAAAHGLNEGFVVQAPGPLGERILIRMTTEAPDFDPVARPLLESLGVVYATLAIRLTEQAQDRPGPGLLSEREGECLAWAGRGKTDWEIGAILDISPKTANHHIENAKRKLDVATRLQAVTAAIRRGLIDPN